MHCNYIVFDGNRPLTFGKPFTKGQSGNPAGRKKGCRNQLGQAFIEALNADFTEHGKVAIATCRKTEPAQYLRVILGILPKHLDIDEDSTLGQLVVEIVRFAPED